MKDIAIRAFEADDADDLAQIYHASVHSVGRRDYSAAQCAAWSAAPAPAAQVLARVTDGRSVFVATTQRNLPVGFVELEADGHIDCFYCDPDWAGVGVGTMLYNHLEAHARSAGLYRLHVEASEAARRFFLRQGFGVLGRNDFRIGDVAIHNHNMEKWLSGSISEQP